MNPVFAHIFRLIPTRYLSKAIIAGGAAACYEKADDIDVWVLGLNDDKKVEKFKEDLRAMNIDGIEFVTPEEVIEKQCDSGSNWNNEIVANIPNGVVTDEVDDIFGESRSKPVQIMASVFMSPSALLSDFDLSTHCIGFNASGQEYRLAATTTTDVAPRIVCSPKSPDRTLSRYRRFCLRYGVAPDPEELVTLCTMPDPEHQNG